MPILNPSRCGRSQHLNIGGSKQELVKKHFSRYKNARGSITCGAAWSKTVMFSDTNNAHISVETYFRFLAQDILLLFTIRLSILTLTLWLTVMSQELYDVSEWAIILQATLGIDYLANLNIRGGDREVVQP